MKKVNPNLSNTNKDNMKKNSKQISKIIVALSVAVIVVLAICMVGCNDTNKEVDFNTKIESIEQAKSVVNKITVVDGEATVYDYTKTITIDGTNAHVNEVEKSLGDNFVMEEKVNESDIENIDKKSFCPINVTFFAAGMKTSNEDGKTVYSNKISAASIWAFITIEQNDRLNIDGEGSLKLIGDNKNILAVELTYNTTTGRAVTVTTTYSY